ncbi:MAG: carbohydrate ABC transporter permease [Ruminococcaceae bacterium]|nr:carbohydrate ABC transporter permease [Oscillospiraceae bacterium]
MRKTFSKTLTTVIMSVISAVYLTPILIVIINSLKTKTAISASPFSLPDAGTFVGLDNYTRGINFGGYPFLLSALYSLMITVLSTLAILLFTSMAAWYITRVDNLLCRSIYYLCVFSMIVPFQMVMFTLSKVADTLNLGNPLGIVIIYLGFGAGLAIFMFCGFVKSIPREIEEAATIDGCGAIRTFFGIVLPVMKPTLISVCILETMWIWNDFLLPFLVLDIKEYRTIPIHIQYLNGSYGQSDIGAIMALIVLSVIPIVIFYFTCQKHIIKGIMAGAVKG